ncbi:LacI family DNA-binding transcriptional regulator [Shimia biformata]|uniref:LacI family DNA-binding transcriptional regulator n=1 Tax=Shimia biformata TaxID=1294299 RepID=UPI0019513C12|nr:LacI family DNA-binding transcriptional regulator [Shimia biformata]
MPKQKHVTLKSIADELGVSVTTVTRALQGSGRIGAETVARVNEAADRLGYVRNLDAVKLRTGQSFVIMTFLSFPTEEEIGDSGSVGLLNGIHKRLAGSDYAVRATPVTMDETGLEAIKRAVKGRNADGIILDHTTPEDARVAYLMRADIPFVTFGRTDIAARHAYFDLDNEDAAYQGTKAMIDRGYRRIALLEGDARYSFVSQRLAGYARALDEADLSFDPALVRHVGLEPTVATEAARNLLTQGADAFVCVNELVFFGARAGVQQVLGPKAGDVGFSMRTGTNLAAYVGSPVSASYYSRMEAGYQLADLLMKRIDGAAVKNCQITARTVLRNY